VTRARRRARGSGTYRIQWQRWLDHHVNGKHREEVKVRGGSGCGGGEGEDGLIKATVTLGIRGILEEDT